MRAEGRSMCDHGALRYQGDDPYLFIASCEEDREQVLSILDPCLKEHRIWLDCEAAACREDRETLARQILNSAGCIAFLTQRAVGQHSFRREICYALEKNKPFLAVCLEPVELTPGLEMELSGVKTLRYWEYQENSQRFFFQLLMMDFVRAAWDPLRPGDAVPAKAIPPAGITEPDTIPPDKARTIPPISAGGPAALGREEMPSPDFPPIHLMPAEAAPEEMDDTLLQPLPEKAPSGGAWLIRNRTGEKIPLTADPLCLGRSDEECGYVLSGNSAISKKHALIFCREGGFCVMDMGSFNRTYLNGAALHPELPCSLQDGDVVRLANEGFTFRQAEEGAPCR